MIALHKTLKSWLKISVSRLLTRRAVLFSCFYTVAVEKRQISILDSFLIGNIEKYRHIAIKKEKINKVCAMHISKTEG